MVLKLHFTKLFLLMLMAVVTAGPNVAFGTVIFEGYYKIRSEGKHIGYTIQRYELDAKANTITSTMFLQTNASGNDVTESLKAVSDNGFRPASYQYTKRQGTVLRIIDAKFNDGQMKFSISNGNLKESGTVSMDKKAFLSTFLGFLLLQEGYSVGKTLSYEALPEENGIAVEETGKKKSYKAAVEKGVARIKGKTKFLGFDVLEVENTFLGATFNSFVWYSEDDKSRRFDWLGFKSPMLGLEAELVKEPSLATAGFKIPEKTLKALFGEVPKGTKNVLVEPPSKGN